MHGWTGRILHIDLSKGTHRVEEPAPEFYERWIGGKGMAGFYLRDRITLPWNDPEMPLLFFAGPLVGTPSPTAGRWTIASRSPLTGTVCDTSVGGQFGFQLKRAGWDGIVITGKASELVGLVIRDGEVEIAGASSMKGWETGKVQAAFPKKGSTAAVGPAAERGVLFAAVCADRHHFSGRGGLGLVMGDKNLKYLHVEGSGKVPLADPEAVAEASRQIYRLAATAPILMGEFGITNYGTEAVFDLMDIRRMMPTDNFRATWFEGTRKVNAWSLHHKYNPKKSGCAGCRIRCKMVAEDGRSLPEFESLNHFTALLRNEDPEAAVEANRVCNETGMDTISAGAVLACYQEVTGKRLSPEEIPALLMDIGLARGEGAELAQGAKRFAESRGKPEAAMTVKGLELPAYDPRGAYGMALGYAVSTRGGCHLRAYPISHEILRKPVQTDRFSFAGKARIVKISEDINAAVDSLTACKFLFFAASLEEFAKAYEGVTGLPATAQDLMHAGERFYYHERLMNWWNGFTGEDDDLPERFFTEPGTSGDGIEIEPIDREEFLRARAAYFKVRGLDEKGIPLREKCRELGLEWKDS